jgi:putative membrane-bound dehydrogenase-like protein
VWDLAVDRKKAKSPNELNPVKKSLSKSTKRFLILFLIAAVSVIVLTHSLDKLGAGVSHAKPLVGSASRLPTVLALDQVPAGPVPLQDAARQISVPDGFHVTLFAGEPDVRQPIAFTTDDRGRLWVVECYSYPNWLPGAVRGQDRVVIFEDQDGDGQFDRRTVFWDQGDNLTGIELGFGGVWLCATPNLLFIPDRDRDDVPDGPPQVVLDGWDVNCKHNAFNALTWGPDGWLYGCNGILATSRVGRPGTPDAERVSINCGVWRFHPTRQNFEVVANGTTNPWGLDFDDMGQMFITNCVIPHLFHVVPGAHFQRMYGQDFNPNLYDLMSSCADHIHWGGGDWTSSRGGEGIHSVAGGGHAHAGAMVYLGDNWPDSYRNSIFMLNIHGRRVNRDRLTRSRSGYVATHEKDFLQSNDAWFRGLEMKTGPDGAAYMTDWSDIGECHDYDSVDGVHRENGRIFRVAFGHPAPVHLDLATQSDDGLAQLVTHQNDWFVRHARRILQERAAAGRDMKPVHAVFESVLRDDDNVAHELRALWALHVTGGLDATRRFELLSHSDENVRAWAVRLECESAEPLDNRADRNVFGKFVELAMSDPSPLVRLHIASALQRVPPRQRWTILSGLVTHGEDATDPNLPLMIWYAVEPLVSVDRATAATLAGRSSIPLVRRFLARRVVVEPDALAGPNDPPSGLDALIPVIRNASPPEAQLDLLRGVHDGLKGRRKVTMPRAWSSLEAKLNSPESREESRVIGLIFGDPAATAALRQSMMARTDKAPAVRERAIQALVEAGVPGLADNLKTLLNDVSVRRAAIRALGAFDDPAIAQELLRRYPTFSPDERADAIGSLASRPAFARVLLAGIKQKVIAPRDVSPYVARQLQAFGDAAISEELTRVWGTARSASTEKRALISEYKSRLTETQLAAADLARGRALFQRTCAACHRLFGEGNDIGPDLTGSNRANLDFILENVLDPNAVVGRDYKLTLIATKDGRVLSGIIRERTDLAIVLQTENERLTLATQDIDGIKESSASMMPEGLLERLSPEEQRDLVAYLGREQGTGDR